MLPRISSSDGKEALQRWKEARSEARKPAREDVATAVRYTLALLSDAHPGSAVEVRVPPYGATQVLPGVSHRRGTPPAVVEMDPQTWLDLATGNLGWAQAADEGLIDASGERTDLSDLLPVSA